MAKKRRQQLDFFAEQLGIQLQHDWYRITVKQLQLLKGGDSFVQSFQNSLFSALECLYPEFEWNRLSFQKVPPSHWKDFHNHKKFFDSIAEQLEIKQQEEWYS